MEKAKKDEEKRLATEEKRKSKETSKHDIPAAIIIPASKETEILPTIATATAPLATEIDAALHATSQTHQETGQSTAVNVQITDHPIPSGDPPTAPATTTAPATATAPVKSLDTSLPEKRTEAEADADKQQHSSPQSPSKRGIRSMFSKLKPRLSIKERSSPGSFSPLSPSSHAKDKGKAKAEPGSFLGGAALAHSIHAPPATTDRAIDDKTATAPMNTVAEPLLSSPSVSSLYDSDDGAAPERGRSRSRDELTASSARDDDLVSSVDDDEEDDGEARDTLAPPPPLQRLGGATESPSRHSKFREEV